MTLCDKSPESFCMCEHVFKKKKTFFGLPRTKLFLCLCSVIFFFFLFLFFFFPEKNYRNKINEKSRAAFDTECLAHTVMRETV